VGNGRRRKHEEGEETRVEDISGEEESVVKPRRRNICKNGSESGCTISQKPEEPIIP